MTIAIATGLLDSASAQNGDRTGEVQRTLPEAWRVDPTPPLDVGASLDAMRVEPGHRVELVVSEPMIGDPVQACFDANGDLWILEMRGYMPNSDGTGEHDPVGRVVRLRDLDGDGAMDERHVFLDNLVLARAIAPAFDGILVVEPPHLLYARDVDGDGRCDDTQIIASDFGGLENPEHAGNGLRFGIDNWYETSQHHQSFRLKRRSDGRLDVETRRHPSHGQWGVARDDIGRLFYSPNSDPLIWDEFPKHYAGRNPGIGDLQGVPRRIVDDHTTWPIRKTPGVNRGYHEGVLREDGTLRRFTAACGPEIFRGTGIDDASGDAFVCEPAGHLVKRFDLDEEGDVLRGTPTYQGREFLASTDERFRPVSTLTGPDGGLYIVDFARGVVQHRIYMTTWLRRQVDDRGLDAPTGRGRVWRVVDVDASDRVQTIDIASSSDLELVDVIADETNGWRRDTAQRLLVERMATGVSEPLHGIALDRDRPTSRRLQAIWTIQGIEDVESSFVGALVVDPDPVVREHGARIAESLPPHLAGPVLRDLLEDPVRRVRIQAVLSSGELPSSEAFQCFETALRLDGVDPMVRSAIRTGLSGREVAFLRSRARPDRRGWLASAGSLQRMFISELVEVVLRRRHPRDTTAMLAFAVDWMPDRPGRSRLLLDHVSKTMKLGTSRPRPMLLEGPPSGWSRIQNEPGMGNRDARGVHDLIRGIDPHLHWPGRPGVDLDARELDPREMVDRGRRLYVHCMSCHQSNGLGLPPLYPPLDGSPYVTGDPHRLARILMHGLEGPIEVLGERYDQAMPAAPISGDVDLAAVMTYIRQAWGNDSNPVAPELIGLVRRNDADRRRPWTAEELETIKGPRPE